MTADRLNPDMTRKSYTPTITQGEAGAISVQNAYEYHDFKVVNFTLTTSRAFAANAGFKLLEVDSSGGGIVSSDGFSGVVTIAGRAWCSASQVLSSGRTVTGTMLLFK